MTKKEMNKIFNDAHISLDLFSIDIYFTNSKDKFIAMCNWISVESVTDVGGRCMLNIRDDGSVMLYIGVFNADLGTLAHECTHAALFIADTIGHKLGEVDELVPYIAGYLFNKCHIKMV